VIAITLYHKAMMPTFSNLSFPVYVLTILVICKNYVSSFCLFVHSSINSICLLRVANQTEGSNRTEDIIRQRLRARSDAQLGLGLCTKFQARLMSTDKLHPRAVMLVITLCTDHLLFSLVALFCLLFTLLWLNIC
jgi:hypothetical protein